MVTLNIMKAALQANLYLKPRMDPRAQRGNEFAAFKNSCLTELWAEFPPLPNSYVEVPPKLPVPPSLSPHLSVVVFGDEAFKEVIKLNEVIGVSPSVI